MIWNEILCLGDSITCGARDEYKRSYPLELSKILKDRTGEIYICHEHAICGQTSAELLKKTWDAAKSRKASNIALLLIGTNDSNYKIPVESYEDNIRQIIDILRIHSMHIIVGLLPKLGFTPIYYKNSNLTDDYNNVLLKLSKELNFDICNLSGVEHYYIDGVHFTNKGYVEIAKKFANTILGSQT